MHAVDKVTTKSRSKKLKVEEEETPLEENPPFQVHDEDEEESDSMQSDTQNDMQMSLDIREMELDDREKLLLTKEKDFEKLCEKHNKDYEKKVKALEKRETTLSTKESTQATKQKELNKIDKELKKERKDLDKFAQVLQSEEKEFERMRDVTVCVERLPVTDATASKIKTRKQAEKLTKISLSDQAELENAEAKVLQILYFPPGEDDPKVKIE